ncbi:hypothetical protein VM1G_08149 [Cytospora mali]|uniref:Uncharacterized protein n=1 Tax=Cytospora mali TaxID=578113 RepID=A0A194W9I0_CYTMA|nr:hypothetical protein VM1G_08149 [Valsa mali]
MHSTVVKIRAGREGGLENGMDSMCSDCGIKEDEEKEEEEEEEEEEEGSLALTNVNVGDPAGMSGWKKGGGASGQKLTISRAIDRELFSG